FVVPTPNRGIVCWPGACQVHERAWARGLAPHGADGVSNEWWQDLERDSSSDPGNAHPAHYGRSHAPRCGMGIEVIEHGGTRYAEVIRRDVTVDHTTFFSPAESSFQFGLLAHVAGYEEPPHYHQPFSRTIDDLQQ